MPAHARTSATALANGPAGPPVLAEAVRRLEIDSRRYFGAPATIAPLGLEDRPVSQVLRVRVSSGDGERYAFVKAYKLRDATDAHRRFIEERIGRDYAVSRRVHAAMQAMPGLSAVHPIAWFPDLLVLVTDEAQGRTLSAVVAERARWWPDAGALEPVEAALARVGQWVAAYQGLSTPEAKAAPFSLGAMREYLDVRLARLTADAASGLAPADRLHLLEYFDATAARVPPTDVVTVPIHADLAPANVLVADDGQVTVIDFAMAAHGGRYHDVSRLHAQLDLFAAKVQFSRKAIDRLQGALLAGFEPGLTAERPLFSLFSLQHVVCHLLTLVDLRESFPASAYSRYLAARHRRRLRALTPALPPSSRR